MTSTHFRNTLHYRMIRLCGASLVLLVASQVGAATVAVDARTTYQTMRGFGASTAWGSSMSATDADLLWSTTAGAGLSLHRIHIDPSNGGSSELPIAKLAVARNVAVWATPWTPPAADKSNNSNVMGTLTNASAFATYLTGFVKKMKDNGVPIYAVSAQNEPDANVSYESCVYDGASMAKWVGKTMGPAFAGSGVKVMGPETQNWYGFGTFWSILKADADFMKYADIVATHEYGGSVKSYPDIQTAGKEFWETEIYDTDGTADVGMGSGLRVAKLIHECLATANMSAWHYWWVYPSTTDNGALWDKASNKPTKRLWVMGNFSRFVRPGYVRIGATAAPTTGVTVSAYLGAADNRIVLVAINTSASATNQEFSITGATATTAVPWVTDDARSLVSQQAVTISGNSFTYSLPAKSVTSLVIPLESTGLRSSGEKPESAMRVERDGDRILVDVDPKESGRIEVRTAGGALLDARDIPFGAVTMEIPPLGGQGLLFVTRRQGGVRATQAVFRQ